MIMDFRPRQWQTATMWTMISEYNLKLIDKKLLQKKLKEYIELAGTVSDEE